MLSQIDSWVCRLAGMRVPEARAPFANLRAIAFTFGFIVCSWATLYTLTMAYPIAFAARSNMLQVFPFEVIPLFVATAFAAAVFAYTGRLFGLAMLLLILWLPIEIALLVRITEGTSFSVSLFIALMTPVFFVMFVVHRGAVMMYHWIEAWKQETGYEPGRAHPFVYQALRWFVILWVPTIYWWAFGPDSIGSFLLGLTQLPMHVLLTVAWVSFAAVKFLPMGPVLRQVRRYARRDRLETAEAKDTSEAR